MVLEDAKYWGKSLCIIDIYFSKAYDSTEHFAKEISLRRMGMPEEGIQLWKQHDSSRKNAYSNCTWTNKRHHTGMRILGTRC